MISPSWREPFGSLLAFCLSSTMSEAKLSHKHSAVGRAPRVPRSEARRPRFLGAKFAQRDSSQQAPPLLHQGRSWQDGCRGSIPRAAVIPTYARARARPHYLT